MNILPCSKCGSTRIEPALTPMQGLRYYICCSCGTQSWAERNDDTAIDTWNHKQQRALPWWKWAKWRRGHKRRVVCKECSGKKLTEKRKEQREYTLALIIMLLLGLALVVAAVLAGFSGQ